MKKVIAILIVLLIFTGCDQQETTIDKAKSESKLKEAYKEFSKTVKTLEKQENFSEAKEMDIIDFRKSYKLCAEAVEADPTNLDAQVCAAVTRILALFKDPNFTTLRDSWFLIDHFNLDNKTTNTNRFKITKFIDESLLPAIDYSLARMAVVDKLENKNYVFLVTPEIHGHEEEDSYEADMTELKLFNSILMSVKTGINITQAYNINIKDYSLEGIKNALSKGSNFLTLKDAQKMKDAMAQAKLSVDKSLEAVNFLLAETDDQENDIIKNVKKTLKDIKKAKDLILEAKDIINNPYSYTHNEVTLTMNLVRFFNNPAQDLKALLPDYTVTIKNNKLKAKLILEDSDLVFPDTTFAGLLDGPISQDDLKYFIDIYNCGRGDLACDSYEHCSDKLKCEWGATCENNNDSMCPSSEEHCSDENYCKDGKRCPNGDSDCSSWNHCSPDNICVYGKRCPNGDSDCSDWTHCSPDNICEDGKRCPNGDECEDYEVCSDDHVCEYKRD